jgi:biopolymer transport protein ExbD
MTVSVGGGDGGGKKSVNAELNLVPFIDFLSTLISFLLVSAVWTQLARINVTQKSASGGAPSDTVIQQPDQLKITVGVKPDNFLLSKGPVEKVSIPKKGTEYDYERLYNELKSIKDANPDKEDLIVGGSTGVNYEVTIRTVDYCIKAGFPTVTVAPADELK